MVKVVTNNLHHENKASFFIQSKGKHSGRPLRKPKPNCFAVYTDNENLYELVYALYISRRFEYYLIGSVIPFIRLKDVNTVITEALEAFKPKTSDILQQISQTDTVIEHMERKLKIIKDLRIALAMNVLK